MNFATQHTRPILMVEDQDVDFELARRGLRRLGVEVPLIRFSTVEETTHFLRNSYDSSSMEVLPGVVILDLRLSDGDGAELLQEIKKNRRLQHIPVVVWSANADPKVISSCYEEGASGYIRKASEKTVMDDALNAFVRYWLNTVTLPSN